jgi:DNA-binding LacI/PurR family transcriptional regulator
MGVWKSERNEKIRNAVLYSPRPLKDIAREHGISIGRVSQIANSRDFRKPVSLKVGRKARHYLSGEARRLGIHERDLIARLLAVIAKDQMVPAILDTDGEMQ